MLYTARQSREVASGALPRHGIRPRGKHKTQLHILQGIPGVGPERACVLLDKFGSVEAVLTASTEELVSIKGIGANTVDTIHWAVREPETEYNDFGEASDPIL
jgi:ERCC4-type nuclease